MGKLFETIASLETLRQAWKQIQKKGAHGGIDGVSVAEFAADAEGHLQDLAAALRTGRYSPEPAARVQAPKFNAAGEFRPLSLPTIKDKIAQQAVRAVIEPFFEKRFLNCSYAYRPQRGAKRAIGRVTHYLTNEKRDWIIFGDLDNFFDTLNHERLLEQVKKVIYEPEILALLRMWIKIGAMDRSGRYHDMDLGIAQGGIVSPLLSNIYAHVLDQDLVDRNMAYVRYADNFVVLCRSREEAAASLQHITIFITESLGLRLNPEQEPVRHLQQGFVFLGVHFRGQQRFLAAEKKAKMRRKLDWLTNKNRPHPLEKILDELRETTEGISRYYGFLNPQQDFAELDRYLLGRMRVLLITRRGRGPWKTKGELQTALSRLPFFAAMEEKAAEGLRSQLLREVFAAGELKPKTAPPSKRQRTQARGHGSAAGDPGPPPGRPQAVPAQAVAGAPLGANGPRVSAPVAAVACAEAGSGAAPVTQEALGTATGAPGIVAAAPPWNDAASASSAQPQSRPVPGPAAPLAGAHAAAGCPSPAERQPPAATPAAPVSAPASSPGPGSALERKAERSADRKVGAKKQRYVRRGLVDSELVVKTPGTFIGLRNRRVVMIQHRVKVADDPLIKVKSILVHTHGVSVSSDLIKACAQAGVPIVFSSYRGHYAILHAPLQSKPELGLLQLKAVQDGTALVWAKALLLGKLKNQLNLLKFYLRYREDEDPVYTAQMATAEETLEALQDKVQAVAGESPYERVRDRLFGFEGQAAACYWEMVRLLLPKEVEYPGRVTRGARDLVNASLNLGYSLLYPRIECALLMAGLNLYTSLLHAPQPGKPTLSYDLIEPFRAPVVDRAVFSLLTRGRDLAITSEGRLSSASSKLVMEAVVGRLGTLVPYKGAKITLDQVIYRQARLLAESLRNQKKFKAFISRY